MDPLLRRGIRLLLAKIPDAHAEEQLRALAEEAIMQKQRNVGAKLEVLRDSPASRHSSPSPGTVSVTRDLKRDLLHQEDAGLSIIPPKRARLVEGSSASHLAPSPSSSMKSDTSIESGKRSDDEDYLEADINVIAMDLTSGINCTVCKKIAFYSANQLVECQECHLVYHQECHKPPISKVDITDPRRVWFCGKCTRSMRKQTATTSNNTNPGSNTRSSTANNNTSKSSATPSTRHHTQSPSKSLLSGGTATHLTVSPSKNSSLSGGSSARPSPFSNLSSAVTTRSTVERSGPNTRESKLAQAAGIVGGGGREGSLGGGSRDSKVSVNNAAAAAASAAPSNNMLSAERRMQLMKKKAAARMAERKKF